MEIPSLMALVGWLCGLLTDCLKTWCGKRLLRRLDPDPSMTTQPDTEPQPDRAHTTLDKADTLIKRLYATVARYRPGEHP